jgi:hypothetical protein
MKNIQLFESFVENLNESRGTKGLMHKVLGIPTDKKIEDVYTSGKKLAEDLLKGVKKAELVPLRDVRSKATSMLAFAANWPSDGDNSVLDKALEAIKDIEIPGVPKK